MRWKRVEVRADFLLILALVLYLDTQGVVPLAVVACIFHEMGHLVALYLLGGELLCLRLSGVGAEMITQGTLSYKKEAVLALAGPLANFATAIAISKAGESPLFSGLNLALGLLNLVPTQKLDGGRAIFALLCASFGIDVAEQFSGYLDWICSIFLLITGIWMLAMGGSFTLLLFGLWVTWTKNRKKQKKRLA